MVLTICTQLRMAAPDLDDEQCQQQVYSAWTMKGKNTRQMKTSHLTSENAGLVSSAASLSSAKMSLAAAPRKAAWHPRGGCGAPPPPGAPPPGARRREKMRSCRSSSPTSPIPERFGAMAEAEAAVTLEEEAVSLEQVSRLYSRGKKSGLW